jgi:hypothetical protein
MGSQERLATAGLNPPWKFQKGRFGKIHMAGTSFCLRETWNACDVACGVLKKLWVKLSVLGGKDVN